MKTKIITYVAIAFLSVPVLAGPSTGGGGFAVLCPETPVSSAKVELLDVYEGRRLGFQMAMSSGDVREDYFSAVKRTYTMQGYPHLADERRSEIMDHLTDLVQSAKFVSTPEEVPQATDLGEVSWIPSQCRVQQMAYFDDRSTTIYILKPLWDKMDTLNQSALLQHEIWYHHRRSLGERTSENTRMAVAQIYAVEGPASINDGLPANAPRFTSHPVKGAHLSSELNVFYAVNFVGFSEGLTRLQLTHVNGLAHLSKTWADFPKMTWDFKLGRSANDSETVDCILQTPGMDQTYSASLNGLMAKGYSISLKLKTGEPVKMTVLNDGVPVNVGNIGGGINCGEVLN